MIRFLTLAMLAAVAGVQAQAQTRQATQPQQALPDLMPRTIAEVLVRPMFDQRLVMQGVLLRQVAEGRFVFSDGTGQIMLDVEAGDVPEGLLVDGKTLVDVMGEPDRDERGKIEIDVDILRLALPESPEEV